MATGKQEATDYAYNSLKEMIFEWQLPPGEKININQLAQNINVSTIPIREALTRLSVEKLVISEHNKGYRVSDILDSKSMRDMLEVRILLESNAVEHMIRSNNMSLLPEMIKITQEMALVETEKSYKKVIEFVRMDDQFHHLIMESGGNAFLTEAHAGLYSHLHIARFYHVRGEVDQKEAVREHEEIIESIRIRDIYEARIAVSNHVRNVRNRVLEY